MLLLDIHPLLSPSAEAAHDDTDVDGSNGGWDAALDEVNVCVKAIYHIAFCLRG